MNNRSPAYNRKTVLAWSLYDFANSAFAAIVVTFIYATYFTEVIAENEVIGTAMWSRAVFISFIIVALLSPFAGAIADRGGYRKRFLFVMTVLCIAGTVILFFPREGQVLYALFWFVVANIAFEMSYVFYNAYLPDIAPPEQIGRISGYGWGLGYIGGLLCLILAYVILITPDVPPFGLSQETGEHVRAANLFVAAWFALFSIPIFLYLKETKPDRIQSTSGIVHQASQQLWSTFREIRQYRQVFRLVLARLFYNDGLVTVFAFGGIFAAGTFGFTVEDIFIFGIILNLASGIGAFAFGFFDDHFGGKATILVSLAFLFAASLLAVVTTSVTVFWIGAIMIGLCAGPNQSASRSLMGRFVPNDKENEFFGFFAFSGKATAFLGPLMLGLFTGWFDSQRAGVASVLIFFVVGAVLLLRVDEKEGIKLANRTA